MSADLHLVFIIPQNVGEANCMNKISSGKKRGVENNNHADVLRITIYKYRQHICILNMPVTIPGEFGGGIK